MKAIVLTLLVFLTMLGFPTNAWAHSVETDYKLNPQSQLELQIQFSTGEPFQMAAVRVYSPATPDTPWMIGATDDQGAFAFAPDRTLPGDWKIRIGENNHADILTVPVTASGVAVDQITEAPTQKRSQWIVLGFAFSSGLGARLLWRRKQRGW